MRTTLTVIAMLAMLGLALVSARASAPGEWQTINTEFGESRHEGASVQAGEAFYVIGGRESDAVRIYDPFDGDDGSWSSGAMSPIQLHHFQADGSRVQRLRPWTVVREEVGFVERVSGRTSSFRGIALHSEADAHPEAVVNKCLFASAPFAADRGFPGRLGRQDSDGRTGCGHDHGQGNGLPRYLDLQHGRHRLRDVGLAPARR